MRAPSCIHTQHSTPTAKHRATAGRRAPWAAAGPDSTHTTPHHTTPHPACQICSCVSRQPCGSVSPAASRVAPLLYCLVAPELQRQYFRGKRRIPEGHNPELQWQFRGKRRISKGQQRVHASPSPSAARSEPGPPTERARDGDTCIRNGHTARARCRWRLVRFLGRCPALLLVKRRRAAQALREHIRALY
jgi:hypothetical protein